MKNDIDEFKLMKYLSKAYDEGDISNDEFNLFILDCLITKSGFITDCGSGSQVNAVVILELYEKIKKHPILWKLFMVA